MPDADETARFIHRLSEDDRVKAVLLRINSPGGSVGAVQEIYTELKRCKDKGKKIVVSMGDVAASGGYYLASAADRIVAEPGTITGSIGVILEFGNLEGLFQKVGVRLEVVKRGAHKDIGSPARPLTPEERRMLQASIDDAYAQFVDAVVQGRKLSPGRAHALADGRIFTGRQALEAGLVDELGNSQDALQEAIRLAHLAPHPPILSDSRRSLASWVRQVSAGSPWSMLERWSTDALGFRLEYLLQ
jgi:protease-4